ncbi:MAG: hypothetical protein RL322_1712 [Pseudomonadota bacterium]
MCSTAVWQERDAVGFAIQHVEFVDEFVDHNTCAGGCAGIQVGPGEDHGAAVHRLAREFLDRFVHDPRFVDSTARREKSVRVDDDLDEIIIGLDPDLDDGQAGLERDSGSNRIVNDKSVRAAEGLSTDKVLGPLDEPFAFGLVEPSIEWHLVEGLSPDGLGDTTLAWAAEQLLKHDDERDNRQMNTESPPDLLDLASRLVSAASEHSAAADDPIEAGIRHQARSTAAILAELGVDQAAQAAAWLIEPQDLFPIVLIRDRVDPSVARLVDRMRQVLRLSGDSGLIHRAGSQQEPLRRMLLAMADDIRVVLLFLAWRLQAMRDHAARRDDPPRAVSEETLRIVSPLANRLGLWQIKWELEDLSFRFLEPETYRSLARQLESKRAEREAFIEQSAAMLSRALNAAGVPASVSGRPKHLYSIHSKMLKKQRPLEGILDLRGLRVIVQTVDQCYQALDQVHQLWTVIESEFDDYIARPKANGYRSLHTVVTASDGLPLEVQIRTLAMHEAAEYGVASHWRYKERPKGGSLETTVSDLEAARTVEWVRALLAWQREVGEALGSGEARLHSEGRSPVYALTPQGRVIELPPGSTPIDFAYHVHSGLGHRCRGARVDGQLVPLNRVLDSGQTVEILSAKEGASAGPSRDWLNPALGYLASARARTKVRQWFNALDLERDQAAGRERIERILQREGRTALAFEDLARRLGQPDVLTMFVAVSRDEIGPRQIEEAVRASAGPGNAGSASPQSPGVPEEDLAPEALLGRSAHPAGGRSGVLIVGMDALLTQLARCCRPVPPDRIEGFVTRGRGVSVHRADCATFARLIALSPERRIETDWDGHAQSNAGGSARFAADIEILAHDRQGLLRDISDVFARDRINVTAAQTQSRRQQAMMRFTIEVSDARQLTATLAALGQVSGVVSTRRR